MKTKGLFFKECVMAKKSLCRNFLTVLVGISFSTLSVFAQEQKNEKQPLDWGSNIDFGVTGNYEYGNYENLIEIETGNLLAEIGAGYYIGRVIFRCYFDIGSSIAGEGLFSDGKYKVTDLMDVLNLKLGLDIGIKLLKSNRLDLILPLGYLFCNTEYKAKEPVYLQDYSYVNYKIDRKWTFQYHNIYSGLDMQIKLNNYFSFVLYGHIGYPFVRNLKYELIAPSGYVWTATGKKELTEEYKMDIFSVSAGLLFRISIPKKII
jgi:hypothetical protein